jgi:hypothetical protein
LKQIENHRKEREEVELLRLENQRFLELEELENQRKEKEELELLRLENQRLHELKQLEEEHNRLEKSSRESEELRLLKEENKRLKRIAKKNKNKKATPKPCPRQKSDITLYSATVPRGIRPGQTFKVTVKGSECIAKCPPNARGGQVINISIRIIEQKSTTTMYTVKVPSGVRPGMTFKIQAKGRIYVVKCPKGVRRGQSILVPLR